MPRLVADKDFLAGTLYMTFGFFGLWLGRSLEAGSAEAMGAGYFPRLICALLVRDSHAGPAPVAHPLNERDLAGSTVPGLLTRMSGY